jgi:hypothetical protein
MLPTLAANRPVAGNLQVKEVWVGDSERRKRCVYPAFLKASTDPRPFILMLHGVRCIVVLFH